MRITGYTAGKTDECSCALLATARGLQIIVSVPLPPRLGNGRWLPLLARPHLDPAK